MKSGDRPIIPLEERVMMLETVKYISEVCPFSFTMKNIMAAYEGVIKDVAPDIFVQGEQANHGHIIPVVKRLRIPILTVNSLKTSATKIIKKIRSFADYEQLVGDTYLGDTITEPEKRS